MHHGLSSSIALGVAMPWAKDWPPARRAMLALYVTVGLVASAVSFAAGQSKNLEIFHAAARDLLAGRNVYASTAFKYSPAFAFLFVPFTWLPGWVAATIWGVANFAAAFYGLDRALADDRTKRVTMAVALVGIVFVTDGDQSNLLITGGMLLAYRAFEARRPAVAGLVLAACTVVKIFPLVALGLVLFDRRRLAALPSFLLGVLGLSLAPVPFVGVSVVAMEHAEWRKLLAHEATENRGWSVMGVVRDGLGLPWPNAAMQALGALVLVGAFVAVWRRRNEEPARRAALALMFVFMVLFNHRSEYCTLVISCIGVAMWCAEAPRSWARAGLVALAFLAPGPFYAVVTKGEAPLLSVLTAPRIFHPLRIVPLFVVWLWMLKDLTRATGGPEAPAAPAR